MPTRARAVSVAKRHAKRNDVTSQNRMLKTQCKIAFSGSNYGQLGVYENTRKLHRERLHARAPWQLSSVTKRNDVTSKTEWWKPNVKFRSLAATSDYVSWECMKTHKNCIATAYARARARAVSVAKATQSEAMLHRKPNGGNPM